MEVTIYTTATCAYCHMLKGYMEKNQIEYTEKKADTDPALAKELLDESGQLGVPFTVIKKESETEKVLGFDQGKLQSALGIA